MAAIIIVSDLPAALRDEELAVLWVDGANSRASRIAPCLAWDGTEEGKPAPSDEQLAEAKLILIGAISRWARAGSGAVTQQTAGPMSVSVDTRQRPGYNLWPSEIEQLQEICSGGRSGQSAFSINPTGGAGAHQPWCSLMLGAAYCSCGSDINGYEGPLYEGGLLS